MPAITRIVKRTGAVVPFSRERITNAIYRAAVAVGGRDRSIAEGLTDQVIALLEATTPAGHVPTVEEIQDIVEKVLIENGHARTAKAYILYREERARRRREQAERLARSAEIPWHKVWESLDWAVSHGLHTVQGLNERLARDEFAEIVRESDHRYSDDITSASEFIAQRQSELRVVIIAGPSSSGKTTTTIKLRHLLTRLGLRLVPLTVDNYFYDLHLHPKDEFGDYDYETPQAIDLALVNQHLARLTNGEEVRIPFYDFRTGRRHEEHTPMRLRPGEVVLIDSLHGLYPPMTQDIADENKFRLYIEPLLQMRDAQGEYIRWTDLRLMRRMVRDASQRAYSPRQTLEHWHYVRSSELRNIIPYVGTVDYVVNSSLPYELPIMRARLLGAFRQWREEYRDDALRQDAAERAERVCRVLEGVAAVEDESAIPADSLLREFIGGSCYTY